MVKLKRVAVIGNAFGLHGRTSALLVETAKQFECDIRLIREDTEADCKSILDVLSLACAQGTEVCIQASGRDAEDALLTLSSLIAEKFGEE